MFKNVLNHLKAKPVCHNKYSDIEMEHLKNVGELKDKERKANWYKHNATKVKESTSQRLKNRSKTEIAIDKQVKKSYDKERFAIIPICDEFSGKGKWTSCIHWNLFMRE